MLKQIYPRGHVRVSALPLLGGHVEGLVRWLHARGYPSLPIRLRLRQLPRVDEMLRRRAVARIEDLSATQLLDLAPQDSQDDVYLAATVRSLAGYLAAQDLLVVPPPTPAEELVISYLHYLDRVRGLAESTRAHHQRTASELLARIGFDGDNARLRTIGAEDIEGFLRTVGSRQSRASLQHTVGQLRSFLRFLTSQGLVASGLDRWIDTPRLYRGERLPRALSWDVVQSFLAAIDRSTPMGRRDFAMFLLVTTYGLRTCEVATLRLDDVRWRVGRLHVPRSKTRTTLVLPLTEEVGAALIDYLRHGRPDLPRREIFLRVRAPDGPLRPTAVTEAFQAWVRRSALPIPYQGPHCLRHSLAVHLLRQGASLKAIGDLLGHRSAESTCVYLRLHVEDLRDVALDLPAATEVWT
jgi:integrase/recombinase XerD